MALLPGGTQFGILQRVISSPVHLMVVLAVAVLVTIAAMMMR